MGIITTIKELERLREIIDVLFEQEFGYFIDKLQLRTHLLFHKRIDRKRFTKEYDASSMPVRLRISMEKLGGGFVKLGQLLSLRPDLISKEYVDEFSKLQDNVEEIPYEDVVNVIESEYGKKLSDVFLKFERIAVASASVSQVHKAWLKNGKKVAVKVQRPNMERIFEQDIALLNHLTNIIEKHYPEIGLNFHRIVEEFESYSKRELDFNTEARNIDIFYNNFKDDRKVVIPRVYKEFTAKRVLVMDFIDGDKLSDIRDDINFRRYKKNLVSMVVDSFLQQVLVYSTFHADLHPGNIMSVKNHQVALLDFGIIGHISHDSKEKIENLFLGLTTGNRVILANSLIELGFVDTDININEFKNDLSERLNVYYDSELKTINISNVLYDLLELTKKYNIRLPSSFILLIKAVITTEGFAKEFYPEYNYLNSWKKHAKRIIRKRKRPDYILKSFRDNAIDFRNFFVNLPDNIKNVINSRSNHKIKLDQGDIKNIENSLNRTITRIAYGIIIAALIIGSTILSVKETKYMIYGFPLISAIFLISAIILFLILIISRKEV
ncbi:AarF/ABC1/UbiB kinase family protein [Candidatus Woesearchaeota archaeon]|nr:AarF/ABC1/UbiB kinase family protein [Candidatus Woesearchaeota archaeon]